MNALGQVVGSYCMELAMEKAGRFGIGAVAARGSNHYGICGYYAAMAMERDLIGFTCTNTSPLMAPTRSSRAALGTNPLALGMAARDGDGYLLDMATTAVALGKIELALRKGEEIPAGWALDADGETTRDPRAAYDAARLMPLGGAERDSGYKGYGLGLMVEVLCGVLSGSQFGPNIRSWGTGDRVADLGHFFMAIDPRAFGPGSKDRMSTLLGQLRELPTVGEQPVLVAGDPEKQHMATVDREGGIAYHPNQLAESEKLAARIGVRPMRLLSAASD